MRLFAITGTTIILILLLGWVFRPAIDENQQTSDWEAPPYVDTLKNPHTGPEAIEAGEEVYNIQCKRCHGKSGKGDGPDSHLYDTPPRNLTCSAVQQQSDGALFWKISKGRGAMPSFQATLYPRERWQLVSYIKSLDEETTTTY